MSFAYKTWQRKECPLQWADLTSTEHDLLDSFAVANAHWGNGPSECYTLALWSIAARRAMANGEPWPEMMEEVELQVTA